MMGSAAVERAPAAADAEAAARRAGVLGAIASLDRSAAESHLPLGRKCQRRFRSRSTQKGQILSQGQIHKVTAALLFLTQHIESGRAGAWWALA
jgi:hypothetical protein